MLTLVLPIYNVEKYITKCLRSIINQTLNNFEVILVDDGSTDDSIEVAKNIIGYDPRFRFIYKKNGGLSSARNAGIEVARGDYFLFIDPDDYVSLNLLESIQNKLDDEYDIIHFPIIHVTEEENKISRIIPDIDKYYKEKDFLLSEGSINYSVCNKCFRRNLFDAIRFPEGKLIEDRAIIHRLLYDTKMTTITDANYFYVKHKGTINRSFNIKYVDDFMSVYDNYEVFVKELGNSKKLRGMLGYSYVCILFPLLIKYLCVNSPLYLKHSRYILDKSDRRYSSLSGVFKYGKGLRKYLVLLFRLHPYIVYFPMMAFLKLTRRS